MHFRVGQPIVNDGTRRSGPATERRPVGMAASKGLFAILSNRVSGSGVGRFTMRKPSVLPRESLIHRMNDSAKRDTCDSRIARSSLSTSSEKLRMMSSMIGL